MVHFCKSHSDTFARGVTSRFCQAGISTCEQANDSERFILEHFDVICDSPSHLYHSALPLSPSSSWIRGCYEAEVSGEVRVLMGLPDRWEACSRTIPIQGKPLAFAYQGDTIAVGLKSSVELLDAITGVRTSALHGHTGAIYSITFSLDGTLLVSTSKDDTVKLWDIQTGGIIGTLSSSVSTVSISPDNTTIAFGAAHGLIYLWDVRTGKHHPIAAGVDDTVDIVKFSPANSRRLILKLGSRVIQQWDVDGNQVGASYSEGHHVSNLAYAPDGTRFVSCGGGDCTVRDSESGGVLNTFSGAYLFRCCFSPDGRFVACTGDADIGVWHATIPETTPVETFVGHSDSIIFLAFSSSLVSGSSDRSVKFWQSSSFLAGSTTTDHAAALPLAGSASISSVKLFAQDSTVVTSDESGVVKTWDFTTGTCISSFSTPAEGPRDTHLEGDTLIIVWRSNSQKKYHIWDVYKGQLLLKFNERYLDIRDIKISGDGSTIFGLTSTYIEALCTQRAEARRVELNGRNVSDFSVGGSKVWINNSRGMGWDFGASKAPRFREFPDRPRLEYLADRSKGSAAKPRWIEDTVTKRAVFHLPGKYRKFDAKVEWDGRYLLVWSKSGEVVVMDFDPVQCTLVSASVQQ